MVRDESLESGEEGSADGHDHEEDEPCEDSHSHDAHEQEPEANSVVGTPNIQDLQDLLEIRYVLLRPKPSQPNDVGTPFTTNILRIALNQKETRIAQTLASDYQIFNTEATMIRAIKTRQLDFLYSIYAFNQNYEKLIGEEEDALSESDHRSDDDAENRYRVFTFDWLFKTMVEYCSEEQSEVKEKNAEECIIEVCKWRLNSSENILKSLLINRFDKIAALHGDSRYVDGDKDQEVFLFALQNENEQFLKYSFRDHPTNAALYTSDVFKSTEKVNVIEKILEQLQTG